MLKNFLIFIIHSYTFLFFLGLVGLYYSKSINFHPIWKKIFLSTKEVKTALNTQKIDEKIKSGLKLGLIPDYDPNDL
jgi:hypothetical protein